MAKMALARSGTPEPIRFFGGNSQEAAVFAVLRKLI